MNTHNDEEMATCGSCGRRTSKGAFMFCDDCGSWHCEGQPNMPGCFDRHAIAHGVIDAHNGTPTDCPIEKMTEEDKKRFAEGTVIRS